MNPLLIKYAGSNVIWLVLQDYKRFRYAMNKVIALYNKGEYDSPKMILHLSNAISYSRSFQGSLSEAYAYLLVYSHVKEISQESLYADYI